MNVQITSKLPHVGTSIFSVMSRLAVEHKAINLSQGFPDFDVPQTLRERVSHYMNEGFNQYAPTVGIPYLREQVALKIAKLYNRNVSSEHEVTITCGATAALYTTINTVVNPGDEVILFDPAYDSYRPVVEVNGGKTVHIPMLPPDNATDWDKVRDNISDKTRLIIINTPHNPTGSLLSKGDVDTLAEIVRDTNILLLSDEVYEHVVFDGLSHHSMLCHDELAERSFVVSSFGKTYHATGWKLGYCVAPKHLSQEFRKIHQFVTFSVVTPIQYAYADYMENHPEHYLNLPQFYQHKRDHFCNLLKDSRFSLTPAKGTFFQLVDYSHISGKNDEDFARYLTCEVGVACIPVSVFYDEKPDSHIIRFCFAKDNSTLQKAAEILCKI